MAEKTRTPSEDTLLSRLAGVKEEEWWREAGWPFTLMDGKLLTEKEKGFLQRVLVLTEPDAGEERDG